jgi:hypothetical protein
MDANFSHANLEFAPGDWVDAGVTAGPFDSVGIERGREVVRFTCADTGELRTVCRATACRAPSPKEIERLREEIKASWNGAPRESGPGTVTMPHVVCSHKPRRGSTVSYA